ncbi:hypothetical protein TR67_19430 [Pseudomonas deceptionensis]|nr:hypothetical protein TR67_19430 [Pseudomonas deceptionensis]
MQPVAADELREAATGLVRHCDEAVAKPETALFLKIQAAWFYDCYAADRSLVLLVSGYKDRRSL